MSAVIFFRFKSEKDKCSVPIEGSDIPVKLLKEKISDLKKLREDMTFKKKGPNPNYSLILINPKNNEEIADDKALIPAGTFLVAKRVLSSCPNTIPVSESTQNAAPVDPLSLKPREEETVAASLAKMIVTGTLPNILACTQCHSRVKDPYITSCCGFTACKQCFSQPVCPKCSKVLEIFQDKQLNFFMLTIENELSDLSGITEVLNNAKYFLLQVYKDTSLSSSVKDSIWEIPPDNSYRLNMSFQEGRNVILIFVNSASSKFHGFAMLMSSVISRKTGAVINIKWIRRADMSFTHMSRLQNPIQRDALTQPIEEISSNSGLEICLMIEQLESIEEVAPFRPIEFEEIKEERKRSRTPEERAKSPVRQRSKEFKSRERRDSPKRHKHKSKEKYKQRR